MRSKLAILAVVSIGIGLAAGCIPITPTTPVVFDQTFNGTTQTVSVGSYFNISLPGNAGTGFTWQVTANTNPGVVLSLNQGTFTAINPGLPGSAGSWVFNFQVIGKGTSTLTLQQFPPGIAIATNTYQLTIVAP